VACVHHHRRLGGHHAEVGKGKIENEQICRRAQRLSSSEDVDDDTVAAARNDQDDQGKDPEDLAHHGVHGGKAAPVGVHQVRHVGQHLPGIKDILGKRWNILWQGSSPFFIFLTQRSN